MVRNGARGLLAAACAAAALFFPPSADGQTCGLTWAQVATNLGKKGFPQVFVNNDQLCPDSPLSTLAPSTPTGCGVVVLASGLSKANNGITCTKYCEEVLGEILSGKKSVTCADGWKSDVGANKPKSGTKPHTKRDCINNSTNPNWRHGCDRNKGSQMCQCTVAAADTTPSITTAAATTPKPTTTAKPTTSKATPATTNPAFNCGPETEAYYSAESHTCVPCSAAVRTNCPFAADDGKPVNYLTDCFDKDWTCAPQPMCGVTEYLRGATKAKAGVCTTRPDCGNEAYFRDPTNTQPGACTPCQKCGLHQTRTGTCEGAHVFVLHHVCALSCRMPLLRCRHTQVPWHGGCCCTLCEFWPCVVGGSCVCAHVGSLCGQHRVVLCASLV